MNEVNALVTNLIGRIESRQYSVGVVGLGYVGLPLACSFSEAGFNVIGFDIDPKKVLALNNGNSYLQTVLSERVGLLVKSGKFEATFDFDRLREADAVIICVPTPLTQHREPDLQFIEVTGDAVARTLRRGQLICLESTTYPGTTEEVLVPRLTTSGLKLGEDFFVAFSPEREDPGNPSFHTATIPKVVGGVTSACLDLASTLYAQAIKEVVKVSSARTAEAVKILENIYRSVNIALVNELKVVFNRMDVDIWEVVEAAKTKPFGYQAFYPGPGLGGHCIPIDPFYLTWKAREYGLSTRFIELAGEVNSGMPTYVVQKLADALNEREKPLKGSKVLVLGVAYKKDINDLRESPALEILELLLAKGAIAEYCDPHVPTLPRVRKHSLDLDSVPLSEESLRTYDAVLLTTDHSNFPYDFIHDQAALIVDSRNAFASRGLSGHHVVKA